MVDILTLADPRQFVKGLFLIEQEAFFYLLTAVHGLHLIGGLFVWGRTALKVWKGAEPYQVRLSVELCTTYWHLLALVWLAILWILITT